MDPPIFVPPPAWPVQPMSQVLCSPAQKYVTLHKKTERKCALNIPPKVCPVRSSQEAAEARAAKTKRVGIIWHKELLGILEGEIWHFAYSLFSSTCRHYLCSATFKTPFRLKNKNPYCFPHTFCNANM